MLFGSIYLTEVRAEEGENPLSFDGNRMAVRKTSLLDWEGNPKNTTFYLDENDDFWIWGADYSNRIDLKFNERNNEIKSYVVGDQTAVLLYEDGTVSDIHATGGKYINDLGADFNDIVKVDIGRHSITDEWDWTSTYDLIVGLKADGSVFRWGLNPESWSLEDIYQIPEGFVAKDVAAGNEIVFLVEESGQLWSVGNNPSIIPDARTMGAMEVRTIGAIEEGAFENIDKVDMFDKDFALALNTFGEVILVGETSDVANHVRHLPEVLTDGSHGDFNAVTDIYSGQELAVVKHSNGNITLWGDIIKVS